MDSAIPTQEASTSGEKAGSDGDGSFGLSALPCPSAINDPQLSAMADDENVSPLGVVRILLVEDEMMQRMAIEALFDAANEKNGASLTFVVTSATNAVEALARVTEDPTGFDLILLDVLLPDTNGYDLLPALRRIVGGDVAIVMASANSQMKIVQLCVRRGADAFLVKPLGSEEVRHLWQFIKDLPQGSFKDDVTRTRESFERTRSSPRGAGSSSDSGSALGFGSVLGRAGAIPPDSVMLCRGHGPVAEPSSASPEGIVRMRVADVVPSSQGVERRMTGDSVYSASSAREGRRVSTEGQDEPSVGADCQQQ